MLRVKPLLPEDFDFAIHITDKMDWQLSREDFEFMLELEPEGCFVLFSDSERIGIATTIIFGKTGWFGNLIVNEGYRQKGAGSLLVNHALKYLKSKDTETVGLYAYMNRIPFYERLGFTKDSEFTVLSGKAISSPIENDVRRAEERDIDRIIDYDRLCFGGSRKKLLGPIISDRANLAYMSVENGPILGYAVAKVYKGMAELGPLICGQGRDDVATNLLSTIFNELEGFEVSMYASSKDRSILKVLKALGVREDFTVARMFSGPPLDTNCIYVAESLERG
jgi:ribosomal protein S18 acetylase RimI-like enzyme